MNLRALSLATLLRYARTWILLAVIPALIAAAAAYVITKRVAKTYSSSAAMYVQQSTPTGNGVSVLPDPNASAQDAAIYTQLITQPVVEQGADQILAKRYPGYRVEAQPVTANTLNLQQQQAPLITVSVTDMLPQRAADAANAIAASFINYIKQVNDQKFASDLTSLRNERNSTQNKINQITNQINSYRGTPLGLENLKFTLTSYQAAQQALLSSIVQLKLTRDSTSSSISVYSPAVAPSSPVGPHPSRNALLWALALLLLGSAGIYGYEYFRDLPANPEELETLAGAPIIGTIGASRQMSRTRRLITAVGPRSPMADAYRRLRTNIQFTSVDSPPHTILVTSPLPRDGKTTTVANLAHVFAEGGRDVTLIDADLRRPEIARMFELDGKTQGLTDLLVASQLNGSRATPTEFRNLWLVPSGPIPPNPADLISSARMREIVSSLRNSSGIVLIDSPPILAVPDAQILATMVDGVVLVVDPSHTRRRDVRHARELIEKVGGKLLGVVVNRVKSHGRNYYHYGAYYHPHDDRTPKAAAPTSPEGGVPQS
jgi:non-specific protein-tyrosine kinase